MQWALVEYGCCYFAHRFLLLATSRPLISDFRFHLSITDGSLIGILGRYGDLEWLTGPLRPLHVTAGLRYVVNKILSILYRQSHPHLSEEASTRHRVRQRRRTVTSTLEHILLR